MFKFYPILITNKKKQKTLPLSLPPQSFRYCLLFAFWHCQIYWKNHGLFFLPSHSLPKCNLTSDPPSLLTWLQIKKPVIFNLDAVRIPLNIYFVLIKTLPWCSLLPHLLLSLLTSLVCSFQTICSIDIDVPPTLCSLVPALFALEGFWGILFMLTISITSYILGNSQVFVALTFLLKSRSVYLGIYWTSPFHYTTGTLILSLLNIKRIFPHNSPESLFSIVNP